MQRLALENKNTPQEYDRIFDIRVAKEPDAFDLKRWKLLIKHYHGGRIADLGCLDSQIPSLIEPYLTSGSEYYGIDQAIFAIAKRRTETKVPNTYFEVGDVYETRFPDEHFSYIVAGELIEHLEDPKRFLREAFRILRRGGRLALSTPCNEAIEPGAVDGERHLWSFTQGDVYKMLRPYGKVRLITIGSEFYPEYKYHFPVIISFCKKQ